MFSTNTDQFRTKDEHTVRNFNGNEKSQTPKDSYEDGLDEQKFCWEKS